MTRFITLTLGHELSRCFHLVGEEPDLWKRCVRVGVDHRQWQQLRNPGSVYVSSTPCRRVGQLVRRNCGAEPFLFAVARFVGEQALLRAA